MVRLTKRDMRLLAKLAAARWLTTSQIAALIFAEREGSVVRRRVAQLARDGYIRSCRPTRTAEVFHTAGLHGSEVLAAEGVSVELEKTLPGDLEHVRGVNDLRVLVETGGIPVRYCYAYWELGRFPHFRRLIPDAAFAVDAGRKLRFVAEYDRSSEPRKVIRHKVLSYLEGLTPYPWDAVLVIAETQARVESLIRHMRGADLPRGRFLATAMPEIRTNGVFGRVFKDMSDPGPNPNGVALCEID